MQDEADAIRAFAREWNGRELAKSRVYFSLDRLGLLSSK